VVAGEMELHFEVKDEKQRKKSLGYCNLSREACLNGFHGPLNLHDGAGRLHVKVEGRPPLDPPCNMTLSVSVLSAKELRNADLFGMSDPYVICRSRGKEMFRTEVIWDSQNPVWNHGPVPVVIREDKELVFEVWDKDRIGKGDKLGFASVTRHCCVRGFDGFLDLGKGNGTLHVRINTEDYDMSQQLQVAEPKLPTSKGAELAHGKWPPMDAASIGQWVELAKGMAARGVSFMMRHIPKCGGQ